jgi:hypothetical protein
MSANCSVPKCQQEENLQIWCHAQLGTIWQQHVGSALIISALVHKALILALGAAMLSLCRVFAASTAARSSLLRGLLSMLVHPACTTATQPGS